MLAHVDVDGRHVADSRLQPGDPLGRSSSTEKSVGQVNDLAVGIDIAGRPDYAQPVRRLAVAAVVFLAGCGGQGTTAVTVTRTVTTLPPVESGGPSGLCTVYARGTGEYVVASGLGAELACRTIIRRWSHAGGTFWSRYGTESSQAELVCAMEKDGLALNVNDVPSFFSGEQTCAALANAGFTEPPPGE